MTGCSLSVLVCDGNGTREHFFERDEGLGARHAEGQHFVLEQMEQVVVVAGKEFDEDVVAAGVVVTFDYLGDALELLDDMAHRRRVAQIKPDIRTGLVAYGFGIDETLRAGDDAVGYQSLDALMDGCA